MHERPSSAPENGTLLTEAEVQRLLLAASERAPTGVRNRALIALLYCSGLRVSEALALDADALVGTRARVPGPRAREAHCFAAAEPYVAVWRALRDQLEVPRNSPLFCTLRGGALSGTYVRAALERLARRAGIAKRVHPHLLRHSCAARLAAQGLDGTVLASQLGQRSLRGARRALQRFGVRLERNDRTSLAHIAWSLAPEPGCVRVCVNAPIARSRSSRGAIVVQRWRPEAL